MYSIVNLLFVQKILNCACFFMHFLFHASINETWQPQTCHESGVLRKITHIFFLLHGSQLTILVFFLSHILISLVSMRFCLTVKLFLQSTSVWSQGLVESSSAGLANLFSMMSQKTQSVSHNNNTITIFFYLLQLIITYNTIVFMEFEYLYQPS